MIGQTRPGNYLFPMSLKIARWFHRKGLSRSKLKGGRVHRWLGDHLLSKHLWVFHRGPMARGWLIGCIICTSPFFGLHLITAVLLAMVFRANIPLTFFIQWSTNVFTVPVYYSLAYAFGCRLLGTKMIFVDGWAKVLAHPDLLSIFPPLFLGCTIIGLTLGMSGYGLIYLFWKKPPPPRSLDEIEPERDESRLF
jgi:uncharacterized protein (DUF2062 family)